MNARLIISLAILGTAYAVSTVEQSPPNEPAQLVTPAPSTVAPAAVVLETTPPDVAPGGWKPLDESGAVEGSGSRGGYTPQPVAQIAHLPAAGGFCTTGNCGPAQARRVYQVQRPVRAGLFRGRLFGRR